jgi:putative DNA primase/helicase
MKGIDKAKDGSDEAGESFCLQVVEIRRHDDGEPVTSCVVVPDDAPKQIRRAIPPKSGNQGVAWNMLVEKLRQASTIRPPGAPPTLPEGCAALPLDFAIGAIRERLTCDPKRKTERTQQALTGLQARGLIRIESGYVWIP